MLATILRAGWEYQGKLDVGKSKPCQDGEDYDLGAMWECPFFVSLPDTTNSKSETPWILCVSPYPHHCSDRPTNPCLYWIGSFQEERFQLGDAAGKSYCLSHRIYVLRLKLQTSTYTHGTLVLPPPAPEYSLPLLHGHP